MSLNIKNEEAHKLAAELAKRSGKSMTTVVVEALRQQLAVYERQQNQKLRAADLMAIGARCASHIKHSANAVEHGNLLYDERGLPA